MRLSWNEIRARAGAFSKEWKDARYEKGEKQSFYNEFFEIFGVRRRSVARYEEHVKKLDNRGGYIDLFWPGVLIVEQKSGGGNLVKAREQAGEYFDALPEHQRPRYILACNFQNFELFDLDERETAAFKLAELTKHVEKFGFILGVQRRTFRDQDPANIKASNLVGRLRVALHKAGYRGHDLERLLVRIVFCLFADDTGVFERDIFLDLIETRTSEDGANLGQWLSQLFQEALDTPASKRQKTLDEDLARFPYVNGRLFEGALRIPAFNSAMRQALLDACRFDWSNISPAIFGVLFQSVMDKQEQQAQGAYYTTEKNILKVIEPLFMDDLRAEFEQLKARKDSRRRAELLKFQNKLGKLKFFDPACGCGNFLIIAYRELRLLEIDVLKEIFTSGQAELDASCKSVVDVDQFYGIEIGEFAARIAETALWMMDHIMNNRLSLEFGQTFVRIPLKKSPHIVHGDALEMDWAKQLLPPAKCSFVFGNPPFGGAKHQTPDRRAQVRRIAALGKSGGTLDYVAAWFIKAGEYAQGGDIRIGFVATNSITQGEQVAQLWPILFERCKLEIAFAHRTFAWGSDTPGTANVHVVIIGFDRRAEARRDKRLFSYPDIKGEPDESLHAALSPYLFDAGGLVNPHLVVREESAPINGMRPQKTGVQMIDNGILTFKQDEYESFISEEPKSKKLFRKYIGGDEYINGFHRWILYLADSSPADLKTLPKVKERIRLVRKYRESSHRESTLAMAAYPTKIGLDKKLSNPFLVLPNASSERREYVPIGWLTPDIIASQSLRILPDATLAEFALLTSAMHMAWVRHVGGRLKSDYSYTSGIIYNTFPTPEVANLSNLEPFAQAVLDARAAHPDATLSNLYDPDLTPPNLRVAHQKLDRAVDRLYRRKAFASERERVEHLFMLYEKMCEPLTAAAKVKPKRRRAPKRRRQTKS